MQKIVDHVFLGDHTAAHSQDLLTEYGISHIINVTDTIKNLYTRQITYKTLRVTDTNNDNLQDHFDHTNRFI